MGIDHKNKLTKDWLSLICVIHDEHHNTAETKKIELTLSQKQNKVTWPLL